MLREILKAWIGSELQSPNWNSYDASAISTATIEAAIVLADRLEGLEINGHRISFVEPGVDGCVVFSDNDESIWIRLAAVDGSAGV